MVKLRMMGPTNELKRMKRIIERNRCLDVISISEVFSNKGTKRYFRQYVDVCFNDIDEKKKQSK